MRSYPIPLMAALLLSLMSLAQPGAGKLPQQGPYPVELKSGAFTPVKNTGTASARTFYQQAPRVAGKAFLLIQFETIPSAEDRALLKKAGIELLSYIPRNTYTAVMSAQPSPEVLEQAKAISLISLSPEQKMDELLARGIVPSHARTVAGTADLVFSFPAAYTDNEVRQQLKTLNIDILSETYIAHRLFTVRIPAGRVRELAALPFVEYLQPILPEDRLLNDKSRANARANVLQSPLGRNLDGKDIVIGIGDDADPLQHIDISSHLINRAANVGNWHGVHVMGTAAGAGIIDQRYQGYAPRGTIIAQRFSNILANAGAYVTDYGMVITNNSYGNVVNDCNSFGVYDLYSRVVDEQLLQYPNLQHVFAAGNSGTFACSPYPAGFSNVLGAYQTAKNAISVGNTSELGVVANGSSKGPVRDGRIKPEITAQGTAVYSTVSVNFYGFNSGTSMASPAVAGGLALLYQRYRQLHANVNPRNGLMKALLCNGATDKGNPGPDYRYGFGWMNLLRSVKMLEQENYVHDSVQTGQTKTITLNVPANIAQLKVMLYWNDPAAAVLAKPALVHDLDLEVTDPASTIILPQLLDTVPANVNSNAITGKDHINNIEQVVINNPAAGTYTFSVTGTSVGQTPRQDYFLVYDTIPVSTVLTYPAGGEQFAPGDPLYISWDAYGDPANAYTIEYTIDGVSWNTISTTVDADLRQLAWTIPVPGAGAVNTARVRITRNGTGMVSTSEPFTIIGVPDVSLDADQCEGYIVMNWTAVTGADDYEVMMRRGDEMVPVAVVPNTQTSYTFAGLSIDTAYWVSVRARISGAAGRRGFAVMRQPLGGSCAGSISDNDLRLDAILAPVSGRVFTASALTAATPVSIRVKNLDDAPVNSYQLRYWVDGVLQATDVIAGPLAAQATYDHIFSVPYDFSATGSYTITAVVENLSAADPVASNDTLSVQVRQLANDPLVLTIGNDFIDDIEGVAEAEYYNGQIGITGGDRYDFSSSTSFGRLRSFVNTGIAASGSKALTLDADRYNPAGTADSLKATFNLGAYSVGSDDIRLDFLYKQHGQLASAANRVWIKGTDGDAWIEAYDLYANQEEKGIYKKSASIELSSLLRQHGQDFSPAFQVRWGQWGQIITADDDGGAGYTFDDIHLYQVANDLQMIRIDTPVAASCGLDNLVPIRITVRNSALGSLAAIPVRYSIDGGAAVEETISSIPGETSVQYEFAQKADLSVPGAHTILAWVAYPSDSYRDNDTTAVVIINSPVISTFPHLQQFELDNGYWYTGGLRSSWEYGTPASSKINRAASGSKAWKTRLAGNYNDGELSYLYSPCYDISGLSQPTLSMSLALDIEDCGNSEFCDGAWMEYSADGTSWTRLGAFNAGTNWYNRNYPDNPCWSVEDYTRWHVATIPLPAGLSRLRLRLVMSSDPFVGREGVAVDDIHIYDNDKGIYTGATMPDATPPVAVNGSNWVDFTSNDQLIASVNANGQDLGNTTAQVFINTGPVRISSNQYYHDRNITIKPGNTSLADSATVRFYFLDTETETLINATGCGSCEKPSMFCDLGVSKYTDTDKALEDGDIGNNTGGSWLFIPPANAVKVPFDKGYYAEFKVRDFSEFWLNNGGLNRLTPLPVQLLSFDAKKAANGKDVSVTWRTAAEMNVDRFEVELAKGNEALNNNLFVKIAERASEGNTTAERQYAIIDAESNKSGPRYYRLKMIDRDGSSRYSAIRPVIFGNAVSWQVYPNPSAGIFNLVCQAEAGQAVLVNIYDVQGKRIRQLRHTASGFVEKISLDLQGSGFAAGLYLAEVSTGEKMQQFRLLKQ